MRKSSAVVAGGCRLRSLANGRLLLRMQARKRKQGAKVNL